MQKLPKGMKLRTTVIYTNQDEAVVIGKKLLEEGFNNDIEEGLYQKKGDNVEFKIGYDPKIQQTINKVEFLEIK